MKRTRFFMLRLLCAALLPVGAAAQGPTLDPSFAPTSAVGSWQPARPVIYALAQQPDGKILVAGDLSQVNGVAVNGVCRLLPTGQVDASFASLSLNGGGVLALAVQADGRIVIGGAFASVGGQPRFGLARLLPDGSLNAGFVPPLGRTPSFSTLVNKVAIQPGYGILVFGDLAVTGQGPQVTGRVARFDEATGAWDATFPPSFSLFVATEVLVQPTGHLVFAGDIRRIGTDFYNVWGTLPDGTPDPAFVPYRAAVFPAGLVCDPSTGNIYLTRGIARQNLDYEPVRLLPNGVRDPSFSTAGAFVPGPPQVGGGRQGQINSLAVQPNGRLLLGGLIPAAAGGFTGSFRLLPSGALDPSYRAANGPVGGPGTFPLGVSQVLVQPNGALLFAGDFTQAGGAARSCLARLLDPNVLSARASTNDETDELTAWPVPARAVLHLRLPAGRPARQLMLLDALGRVVRRQDVPTGQTAPTLPTAGLLPGAYLLHVSFATGPPAFRRVAVE